MDWSDVRDALTPEWRWPESKLVWAMRGALVALALYSMTVEPRFTTRPLLVGSALAGLAASLGFAFVPTQRPRTLRAAEAATLGAFLLHVCGHAFGWYAASIWYDKLLHFVETLALVLILFALSQATRWMWDWERVRPFEVAVYVFSIAIAFDVGWELVEFGMDTFFGTQEQNDNTDTMLDLLADVVGGLMGALVAAWLTRRAHALGPEAVSERPKRPYASRAPPPNAR